MNKATKIHLLLSGTLAGVSIFALCLGWSGYISGVVVVLVKLYLVAILLETFHRSGEKRKVIDGVLQAKPTCFFPFPSRSWLGILILFMVSAALCGFANIYLYSGEIVYVGPIVDASNTEIGTHLVSTAPSILKSKIDALYFSLVTMITLGFGEYLPISTSARLLVIWQLTTGGLLAIGVFPLIVSRVSDY